jgi:hypothetical protein
MSETVNPKYIRLENQIFGDGEKDLIGIEIAGDDGVLPYIFAANIDVEDKYPTTEHLATFLARIDLQFGAKAAFGPPVDLRRSLLDRLVVSRNDANVIGLYVDPDHRPAFLFRLSFDEITEIQEIVAGQPEAKETALLEAHKRIFLPPRSL